jgi:type I restriction enzyme S subunit
MNNEWFFEKFALIADAPGAVDRIRELVLDLAVQGKLVEQSSNDETTDLLLKRLSGSDVSSFDPTTYHPSDAPLNMLPINWRWAPTSLLCDLQTGKRMKGGAQETGVISLGGEHLKPDGSIDYSVPRYVSTAFYNDMKKGKVRAHDTLMVKDGATTGKTAFVSYLPSDGLAAVNEHVFILRWHEPIEKKLAFYFMRAFAIGHIATKSAGLIGGIRREAVLDFPFPLPPLAEQKRIVAKVDELMGLCDELEGQQQERELRKSVLVRSSLSRFAESPTSENLGYLFHNSYDIPPSELRKSILTLAVQGKLVPQDPNDEPAAAIEMQIAKRMSAIRNQRYHAFTATEDQTDPPFSIPHNWKWMPFGTLGEFLGGGTPSKDNPAYWNGEIPWVSPKDMKRPYIYDSIDHVTPLGADASSGRLIPTGALLMVVRGMILAHTFPVAITKREVTINQDMKALRLTVPEIGEYLLRCCTALSGAMLSNVERSSHGTCRIPTDALSRFLVPIPPLAEQHRIVAKVDQLMALVDELERQQDASRENATKLLDAIVQEMTSGG